MHNIYQVVVTEISVLKLKQCMLQCHTFCFVLVKSWIRKDKKL